VVEAARGDGGLKAGGALSIRGTIPERVGSGGGLGGGGGTTRIEEGPGSQGGQGGGLGGKARLVTLLEGKKRRAAQTLGKGCEQTELWTLAHVGGRRNSCRRAWGTCGAKHARVAKRRWVTRHLGWWSENHNGWQWERGGQLAAWSQRADDQGRTRR